MRVHSALPDELAAAVEAGLGGLEHVTHGSADDMRAAGAAAGDVGAIALIGPFRFGDPVDPPVWLWHAAADWALAPDRPL